MAGIISVHLAFHQFRAGIRADSHEHGGDIHLSGLPRHGVLQLQTADLIVFAEYTIHHRVSDKGDLLICARTFQHDGAGAELLAAVHHHHALGETCEKQCFFHCGISATDHSNILVAEEKTIAGGA